MEREYFAGEFDLERPKGRIYDKKPFKIELEAGKLYAWCSCGISRNQVRSVFNCSFMSISFRLSRVPLTTRSVSTRPFLPSATVVAERLCFHRCLSVHRGEVYTPPGQADTHRPPPGRLPVQRTVRILLECILVCKLNLALKSVLTFLVTMSTSYNEQFPFVVSGTYCINLDG